MSVTSKEGYLKKGNVSKGYNNRVMKESGCSESRAGRKKKKKTLNYLPCKYNIRQEQADFVDCIYKL